MTKESIYIPESRPQAVVFEYLASLRALFLFKIEPAGGCRPRGAQFGKEPGTGGGF